MCFDFLAFIGIVWNAAVLLTLDWCTLHSCSFDLGFGCLFFSFGTAHNILLWSVYSKHGVLRHLIQTNCVSAVFTCYIFLFIVHGFLLKKLCLPFCDGGLDLYILKIKYLFLLLISVTTCYVKRLTYIYIYIYAKQFSFIMMLLKCLFSWL